MNLKHGSLESVILNSLWELEKCGIYKNSVKDVFEHINNSNSAKRAYTTIKTVMDRLYEKEVLLRIKQGKKFFYRTAYSSNDIITTSLQKIATQYCNGDIARLASIATTIATSQTSLKV